MNLRLYHFTAIDSEEHFVSGVAITEYLVVSEDSDSTAMDFQYEGFQLEDEFEIEVQTGHVLPVDRMLLPAM